MMMMTVMLNDEVDDDHVDGLRMVMMLIMMMVMMMVTMMVVMVMMLMIICLILQRYDNCTHTRLVHSFMKRMCSHLY